MATGWVAVAVPAQQPASRFIIDITNGNPAVFTTSNDGENPGDHLYNDSMIIRLVVPPEFGMSDLNGFTGSIIVLSSTTFSMNVNTTNLTPFSVPSEALTSNTISQFAQSLIAGSTTVFGSYQNTLPTGRLNASSNA